MKRSLLLMWALVASLVHAAEQQKAGESQAVTISIYDQGFALVQELRRVTLAPSETEVLFEGLPRTLDPATTAFTVTAGPKQAELLEQSFTTNATDAELRWLLKADGGGPAALRMTYRADGISWRAAHEMSMNEDGSLCAFSTRVALNNQSGHTFENARLKLVLTERGAAPKLPFEPGAPQTPVAQRFNYGEATAAPDRLIAGLATVQTFELPEQMTLPSGTTKFVTIGTAKNLPSRRLYVYDGVRFDRFQRSRLTDWNFGTESHNIVDAFVEFENEPGNGLGQPLLPGKIRLTQKREEGAMDFLGESDVPPRATNATVRVRLGPARGLYGERERIGYSEIRAAHEYEESFEIRLKNESDVAVVVRVVEHLYRSSDFEIVKADTEYKRTDPQVIEFSAQVKPGGQRSVHYTVHYRW